MSVMFSLIIALTFSGVFGATPAQAETTFTISGSVTDTNGNPVPCFVFAPEMNFVGSPIQGIGLCGQFSAVSSAGIKNIRVAAGFDLYGNYVNLLDSSSHSVDAFNLSATINIETNTTLNIVLPIPTQAPPRTVTVVDTSSTPLAGVQVGTSVTGVANFGTSNSWRFDLVDPIDFPGGVRPALGSQCTSGADGSCIVTRFSFPPETGITGEAFIAPDTRQSVHPMGNLVGSAPLSLLPTTIVASPREAEARITGAVKSASGETVAGAVVRTSAGSTATTNSDGTYQLWVLTDSLVQVAGYASIDFSTREIIPPPALVGLESLTDPCSVYGSGNRLPECVALGTVEEFQISSDRSIDIELPLIVEQQFHVQDVAGNPVESAMVLRNGGNFTPGSTNFTAEGSAVTHMLDTPVDFGLWSLCLTDAAGNCSQPFLSDSVTAQQRIWALGWYTQDLILDCYTGIDAHTNLGPPLLTIVLAPFDSCAFRESMGTTSGEVKVSTDTGEVTGTGGLTGVTIVEAPALPAGLISPTGELAYTVNNVPVGSSIDVTIDLPTGSAPTSVYKNTASGLLDISDSGIATITGDRIVMHLTDGGFGDEDELANGVIVDPVISVKETTTLVGLTSTRSNPTYGQRTLLKTVITGPLGRRIPSGTVRFSEGGTTLGTATVRAGRANFILPPTSAAGEHQITATYSDIDGGTVPSASALVTVTVQQAITRMVVSGPSAKLVGELVTLGVRVLNRPPGKGVPTGTVTFTDNGTPIGTVDLDVLGKATLNTSALLAGAHTIVATYSGGPNHTSSDSTRSLVIR